MHIAPQKHRIADPVLLQRVGHTGAGCGVAVPAIVGHAEPVAGLEVPLAEYGLLAQHRP
jgi:hypothetical protein